MIKKMIVAVLASSLSIFSFASDYVIFSCTNNQWKKVEVKEINGNMQYSFGRSNSPELVFKNTKAQAMRLTKNYGAIGQKGGGLLFCKMALSLIFLMQG